MISDVTGGNMTTPTRDPKVAVKPAYISYCRKCGGMTGCCADTPERAADAAQFASECIAAGMTVERKTANDVWNGIWCNCDRVPVPEQPTLFPEA